MRSDNTRKYPDATRQPRHLDRLRKETAANNKAAYDALTLEQKIARLPPEPFAAKQRKRLLALRDKKNTPAAVTKS